MVSDSDSYSKVLKEHKKMNHMPIKQEAERKKGAQGKECNQAKENIKVQKVKSRSILPQGK